MHKHAKKAVASLLLIVLATLLLMPVLLSFIGSLLTVSDVTDVLNAPGGMVPLIPSHVTLAQYHYLFIENLRYFRLFSSSLLLTVAISLVHTVVSLLGGYVLAKVRFFGRSVIRFFYILFMVLPLQVTMLPNFLMAHRLGIYNTRWSLFFPGVFAALGVFMMEQFIRSVPDELCACARLETKSTLSMLLHVIAPYSFAGVITLFVIAFSENWNMVEQPLLLISNPEKYPLSLLLNQQQDLPQSYIFAGSALFMLPSLLLFTLFRDRIISSMDLGGISA